MTERLSLKRAGFGERLTLGIMKGILKCLNFVLMKCSQAPRR